MIKALSLSSHPELNYLSIVNLKESLVKDNKEASEEIVILALNYL